MKTQLILTGVLLALAAPAVPAQTYTADNGNGTFTNPLFLDEFSDPDMIRVGSDFYLTGTTMHSMPGLPVLHSKDLVNWTFLGYALDKLDLGPSFRLEGGKNEYGRGIWAPCLRYHNGTFYIFSNVNGQTTQLFRAKDPRGPWTRTSMKRSLHDLSVLFDDDGKAYVVWGYRGIRVAQLNDDLTDFVPGTEREIIPPGAGLGEGLHLYKLQGKYFLTSAWFMDEMRMPTARAASLDGPWEVNQNVSRGEDFGLGVSYRLAPGRPPLRVNPPDNSQKGRCAIHQGGIVDTPTGEWWGFSMMDANAVGRLTALSPVTWTDGWPYFGLPGNLGRTPRTWVKPNTGATEKPHAPYQRSDDFAGRTLQPLWQWNHVPVDGAWSLSERPGYLRLRTMPAQSLWDARNTLTQRAIGPVSTVTVVLDAVGLSEGGTAGLALFNRPYAWLGVERTAQGLAVKVFDEQVPAAATAPVTATRLWLRAECDFRSNTARFRYSTDGREFKELGSPHIMAYGLITFQGVRYSLFAFHGAGAGAGVADFDSVEIREEPKPAIPYGRRISLRTPEKALQMGTESAFDVVDRGKGRVALRAKNGFVSVAGDQSVSIRKGAPAQAETFQWIVALDGRLTLLSLETNRYLRIDPASGRLTADSPGPRPDGKDGVRFEWR